MNHSLTSLAKGSCAILAMAGLLVSAANVQIKAQDRVRIRGGVQAANGRIVEILAAPQVLNRQPVVDQIRRQLEPMLKVELSFVNRAANLNEEERQALIAASLKWFDQFVADFVKNQDPNEQQMWLQGMRGIRIGGDRSAEDPRESVERAVARVVSTTLSKEKAGAYERECLARTNFYREVVVANLVGCVDEKLNLSGEQRLNITDSLLENWENGVPAQLEVFLVRNDALTNVAESWMRPELSEPQRRLLSRMNKINSQEIFYGQIGWAPNNEVIEDIDLDVQKPIAADKSPQ